MKRYTLGRREAYDDVVGKTFKKGRTSLHEGGSIWDTPREIVTYWIWALGSLPEWGIYMVDVENTREHLTEKGPLGWRELLVDSPIFAAVPLDQIRTFETAFDAAMRWAPESQGSKIVEYILDLLFEMWAGEVKGKKLAVSTETGNFSFGWDPSCLDYSVTPEGNCRSLRTGEDLPPDIIFGSLLKEMTGQHSREALWKGLCLAGCVPVSEPMAICPLGFPGCACMDCQLCDPILEERILERLAADFNSEQEGVL